MYRNMLKLIQHHRPGFSLDQPFYKDPDFFRVDMALIWYRDWLFIGHDCKIAKPGGYFAAQVGDYPIVVVRGRDGVIRALHNSCRHRGSRVCAQERGVCARLVCPYCQWTCDLDGKLLFARQMADGFDKGDDRLKPIACESVAGYIFICLADEPVDFAPFRASMEPYFLPHRLTEAKVAYESSIVEKGNWKLVWENNRECYHCPANHPELCGTYPESPVVTSIDGIDSDPAMLEHRADCEAAGLPSWFQIDEAGQYRLTRTPLLDDSVSYTMSGRPAVKTGLSDSISAGRIGTLMLYHYPTTWNHVLIDHAVTFRVLPISATQTAVTTRWLVHREAREGVDCDLADLIHVWTETNAQDRRIAGSSKRMPLASGHRPTSPDLTRRCMKAA